MRTRSFLPAAIEQHKATEQWYEIQDLHVQETMPQLIGLSEVRLSSCLFMCAVTLK